MASTQGADLPTDKKLNDALSSFKAFKRLIVPLTRTAAELSHLAQLDDSPDVLHRLRVTLRRLRSLLWAFESNLPEGRARYWRATLAEAADLAGETRDWDVMIEQTLPKAELDDGTGMDELHTRMRQIRDEKRLLGRQRLQELKLDQLMVECITAQQLLEKKQWRHASQKIRKVARKRLHQASDAMTSRIRKAQSGDVDALHQVRISIKRVRYLTEFFGPVLKKKHSRQLKSLVSLQTGLGELNDKAAARERLNVVPENPETAMLVLALKSWLDGSISSQARVLRRRLRDYRAPV